MAFFPGKKRHHFVAFFREKRAFFSGKKATEILLSENIFIFLFGFFFSLGFFYHLCKKGPIRTKNICLFNRADPNFRTNVLFFVLKTLLCGSGIKRTLKRGVLNLESKFNSSSSVESSCVTLVGFRKNLCSVLAVLKLKITNEIRN